MTSRPLIHLLVRAWLLAFWALQLACATSSTSHTPDQLDIAWPPDQPKVRLVSIIEDRKLSPGRSLLRAATGEAGLGTLFSRPYGLAWIGNDLLVTDPAAGTVVRVSPHGRVKDTARGIFRAPIGIAVCRDSVVVSDPPTGRVVLLDASLRQTRILAEGLVRPTGVTCHENRVFVTETGRHRTIVLPLAEAGNAPTSLAEFAGGRGVEPGQFNFPTVMATYQQRLLIGDTLNFRIQQFDLARDELIDIFGDLGDAPGEMPRLKGLAVDAQGHLWVSDALLDQVGIFALDGTFLMSLGSEGSAPGQFSFPAGVAAHPDGRVAVADSFNHRIQLFTLIEPEGAG